MDEIDQSDDLRTVLDNRKEIGLLILKLVYLEWEDLDIFLHPYLISKKRLITENVIWEILMSLFFNSKLETKM